MKSKYTKEMLEPLVASSQSMRELIYKLGLYYSGGNFSYIKGKVIEHNLSMGHFKGQGWAKNKISHRRKAPNEYLIKNSTATSDIIKKRILRDKVKPHQCEECFNVKWNGLPIPLEIHHNDGNSENNLIENIKLLCPNCHAQTLNFAGKAKKRIRML